MSLFGYYMIVVYFNILDCLVIMMVDLNRLEVYDSFVALCWRYLWMDGMYKECLLFLDIIIIILELIIIIC